MLLETASSLSTLQEQMLLIRLLEDRLQELCNQGLGGDLHFSKGQEAISVGVCAALRDTDYMVTHHRTIAHAVAKGVPLEPLIAEILGKASGMNGGMAGEMHMSYPDKRFLFSFQLVGTCVSVAAGLAWAVKNYKKTDDIVVVFHGDAATANGQFHEGLNIAAAQKLPLLLVCEDNHLAGNVTSEHYMPVPAHQRAIGYGVRAATVDGNNVESVIVAARDAIAHVRNNSEPFMLVCETTRLGKHKQGMGDMRSPEEIERLSLRDPLRGLVAEPEVATMLDQLLATVLNSPDPDLPSVVR